jgi:hypothetical protein
MKQTCIARNNEDVASLLGQCERIMGVMRSNPDADHIYTNTHMETITGLDVLSSPTSVEIHADGKTPYTITLVPDATRSIDESVSAAVSMNHNSDPHPSGRAPQTKKDIRS